MYNDFGIMFLRRVQEFQIVYVRLSDETRLDPDHSLNYLGKRSRLKKKVHVPLKYTPWCRCIASRLQTGRRLKRERYINLPKKTVHFAARTRNFATRSRQIPRLDFMLRKTDMSSTLTMAAHGPIE